jgi:4-diphosphocytidyl-2-C-methyl-D-erythritol kinase
VTSATAPAKLNLALVVGQRRRDGKHELVTVYQRIALADRIELEPASALEVEGFAADTLVRGALELLAEQTGREPGWRVRISKEIPVATGLGGGSSDAAAALRLANASLAEPLGEESLRILARSLGADIPFFLTRGPQLGEGEGAELRPLALPQDYAVLLLLPEGDGKQSTEDVYRAFDARAGWTDFTFRRGALTAALARIEKPLDLAELPPNDLATSPFCGRLRELGAFRADVTGAGPVVYGLFESDDQAAAAASALAGAGWTWLTRPAW